MSKAFKPEDSPDDDELPDDIQPLPSGVKNYITKRGYEALQTELRDLVRTERPKVVEIVTWAASNGDRSENGDYLYGKKRLREIDRRIRHLNKRLELAEVVDPRRQTNRAQVFFGARVTYATQDGTERQVRLVGIDEADQSKGEVSWIAPIARALLKARIGDEVDIRTPNGLERIEVLAIEYPED
jgi:transcription elongation factor GreB